MDEILNNVSIFSVLVPLFCGLILLKSQEANGRIMLVLLLFASIPQLASAFTEKRPKTLYNLYIIVESVLMSYLFFKSIQRVILKSILLSITIAQLFIIIYFFITRGIRVQFFAEFICLHFLTEVIWVLLFFYENYLQKETRQIEHQSMFWFCLGILIYAPCAYFYFAHYHIISKDAKNFVDVYMLYSSLNALMYLIFTVGMIVNYRIKVRYK